MHVLMFCCHVNHIFNWMNGPKHAKVIKSDLMYMNGKTNLTMMHLQEAFVRTHAVMFEQTFLILNNVQIKLQS